MTFSLSPSRLNGSRATLLSRLAFAALAFNAGVNGVRGCACGCGIFDVGTSTMLPSGQGGMGYLEYDFQDQNRNRSGTSLAPAENNPDKDLRTGYFTLGTEYMFNRSWGAQVALPYDHRSFETTGGPSGNDLVRNDWSGPGDIRLKGLYTGFSPDLSAGVSFGAKLPTGSFSHEDAYGDIDRDTELGSGSTDLLLGGFFRHQFQNHPAWNWFGQVEYDQPVLIRNQYRPGAELDAVVGGYYGGWFMNGHGMPEGMRVTPVFQLIGSFRGRDSGANAAHPVASGYSRLMLSPGIEIRLHPVSIYADVEAPMYQRYTGNQLAAPVLFKVIASFAF
jgi:hypothetical protein